MRGQTVRATKGECDVTMKLKGISIEEAPSYSPVKGKFVAKARVTGTGYGQPEITITVEPEQLEPILAIIQQIVVANMADAAEQFRQTVMASLNPPVEHAAITA
jgi:hypothetical protein